MFQIILEKDLASCYDYLASCKKEKGEKSMKKLRLILVLTLVAALLAACGGAPAGTTAPTTVPTEAPTTEIGRASCRERV